MLTMKGENMEELTTAESMVMKTIWDHPHEMALQEIMKLTNETYGKDWKSHIYSGIFLTHPKRLQQLHIPQMQYCL